MFVRSPLITIFTFLALPVLAYATSTDSLYSNLSADYCKTIEVEQETGDSVQRCPGVAGHSLLVQDYDARQSVTILTPDGQQHPLRYPSVITAAFSTVGKKAEWRVKRKDGKVVPIALIVRVYAHENPASPSEKTSYLAVAKIMAEKICVTKRVKAGARANEEARRAADASVTQACLGGPPNGET